jgi:invasion protein IalB
LAAAAAVAFSLGISGSFAQTKPAEKAPAKPAAGAPAAGAAAGGAAGAGAAAANAEKRPDVWYKLCVDAPVVEPVKEGAAADPKAAKPAEPKKVNVCLTQADVRDKTTALLVGKVAVRQVEGSNKPQVLAMLPLGSVLPAGALIKVDEGEPIKLAYTHCHMEGCVAESTVEAAVVDQMKKGKLVGYFGKDLSGRTLSVPIPLEGFAKAHDGAAIPIEKYNEDQKKIAEFIRKRLADLNEKAREQQQGGAAAGAPAQAPAAAASAPAKKQ